MSSQQEELLLKLYSLYKKRYQGQTLEKKFNDAVSDLIEEGDISKTAYIKFCAEYDIEPELEKFKKKIKKSSNDTGYPTGNIDPCGHGGYTRSHC